MGSLPRIIGSLQWLSMQSRLDISFEVNQLQKRIPDLRVFDLLRANALVKEVKNSGSVELVVENQGRECEIAFLGGLSSGLKAFWLPCLLASRLWLPSFWLEIELSLEALSVSWNPTEGKNEGRKEGGKEGSTREGRHSHHIPFFFSMLQHDPSHFKSLYDFLVFLIIVLHISLNFSHSCIDLHRTPSCLLFAHHMPLSYGF